jgi:hypothetical protein
MNATSRYLLKVGTDDIKKQESLVDILDPALVINVGSSITAI